MWSKNIPILKGASLTGIYNYCFIIMLASLHLAQFFILLNASVTNQNRLATSLETTQSTLPITQHPSNNLANAKICQAYFIKLSDLRFLKTF